MAWHFDRETGEEKYQQLKIIRKENFEGLREIPKAVRQSTDGYPRENQQRQVIMANKDKFKK